MEPDEFKALRKTLGWTQEHLAREIGVALATVQRWEMGQRKISHPIALLVQMLAARAGSIERP